MDKIILDDELLYDSKAAISVKIHIHVLSDFSNYF